MGTRSTIQFKIGRDKKTVFVHFDGYHDIMVPEIQKFLKWNGCRNDDVGQTAANYVFHYKYTAMRKQVKSAKNSDISSIPKTMDEYFDIAMDNMGITHMGCSVTDNNHQDEEYFYIVDLKKKVISEQDNKWGFDEKFEMPLQIAQ